MNALLISNYQMMIVAFWMGKRKELEKKVAQNYIRMSFCTTPLNLYQKISKIKYEEIIKTYTFCIKFSVPILIMTTYFQVKFIISILYFNYLIKICKNALVRVSRSVETAYLRLNWLARLDCAKYSICFRFCLHFLVYTRT